MPVVTEVILFPDPVVRAIAFLTAYLPADVWVSQDIPADRPQELVTVTDTGGAGVHDHVLDETRLTLDVWAPNSPRASQLARTIYALLRAWPGTEPGVYLRKGWSRPAYFPDSETRIPRYVLTVTFSFRGEAVEVSPV